MDDNKQMNRQIDEMQDEVNDLLYDSVSIEESGGSPTAEEESADEGVPYESRYEEAGAEYAQGGMEYRDNFYSGEIPEEDEAGADYGDAYDDYEKPIANVKDFSDGMKLLSKSGTLFVGYVLMIVYFFVVLVLVMTNIVSNLVGILLVLPVVAIIGVVFLIKHKDDEDSLM